MMPNSWFYKLRDMSIHGGSERMSEAMKHRCSATTTAAASTKLKPISQPSTRLDCIPTRSSVYYSSKERTEKLPHSPVTRGERHQNYGKQKVQLQNKVLSESFVVVKSSMDPQNDFWASMVEMIVENEIRRPTDLEELLACYLSLNSKEFHGIIIKVFAQIWFDLGLHRE